MDAGHGRKCFARSVTLSGTGAAPWWGSGRNGERASGEDANGGVREPDATRAVGADVNNHFAPVDLFRPSKLLPPTLFLQLVSVPYKAAA